MTNPDLYMILGLAHKLLIDPDVEWSIESEILQTCSNDTIISHPTGKLKLVIIGRNDVKQTP